MQEAFRRAAQQNPNIPISQDIKSVVRELAESREFEYLNREFRAIGKEWFLAKASPLRASLLHITESSVRQKWQQSLPRLQRYNSEYQVILLNEFCQGMGLSEENPHPGYHGVIDELQEIYGRIELLKRLRGQKGPSLSTISKMFLDVFQDISSDSDDQRKSLGDFMETKARLPPGKILLPQTLAAVTLWLKNTPHPTINPS